jgi:hypothetical protein
MSLPVHSVLKLREPPADVDYPYSEVEVTGFHNLGPDSGGIELVLASVNHFAPNFCVPESALGRIGYDLDIDASRALEATRLAAAAKVISDREAALPDLPWAL